MSYPIMFSSPPFIYTIRFMVGIAMFLFLLGKIGFLATIGFTLMMMISHPILQIGVMLSYEYLWVNTLTYHIAWDKQRFLGTHRSYLPAFFALLVMDWYHGVLIIRAFFFWLPLRHRPFNEVFYELIHINHFNTGLEFKHTNIPK